MKFLQHEIEPKPRRVLLVCDGNKYHSFYEGLIKIKDHIKDVRVVTSYEQARKYLFNSNNLLPDVVIVDRDFTLKDDKYLFKPFDEIPAIAVGVITENSYHFEDYKNKKHPPGHLGMIFYNQTTFKTSTLQNNFYFNKDLIDKQKEAAGYLYRSELKIWHQESLNEVLKEIRSSGADSYKVSTVELDNDNFAIKFEWKVGDDNYNKQISFTVSREKYDVAINYLGKMSPVYYLMPPYAAFKDRVSHLVRNNFASMSDKKATHFKYFIDSTNNSIGFYYTDEKVVKRGYKHQFTTIFFHDGVDVKDYIIQIAHRYADYFGIGYNQREVEKTPTEKIDDLATRAKNGEYNFYSTHIRKNPEKAKGYTVIVYLQKNTGGKKENRNGSLQISFDTEEGAREILGYIDDVMANAGVAPSFHEINKPNSRLGRQEGITQILPTGKKVRN